MVEVGTKLRRHARACPGHPRSPCRVEDVDGRVKPGHDAVAALCLQRDLECDRLALSRMHRPIMLPPRSIG